MRPPNRSIPQPAERGSEPIRFGALFDAILGDPQALGKLATLAVILLITLLLTVILVGLIGYAVIVGWQVRLIRNVRGGARYPMPAWDDLGGFLTTGVQVIGAFLIYTLPLTVIGAFLVLVAAGADGGRNALGGIAPFTSLLGLCLSIPMIVYALALAPLFTIALGGYAVDPRFGVFFEITRWTEALRRHPDAVILWFVYGIIISFMIVLLMLIPIAGWVAAPPIGVALHAMLAGSLARAALGRA